MRLGWSWSWGLEAAQVEIEWCGACCATQMDLNLPPMRNAGCCGPALRTDWLEPMLLLLPGMERYLIIKQPWVEYLTSLLTHCT